MNSSMVLELTEEQITYLPGSDLICLSDRTICIN